MSAYLSQGDSILPLIALIFFFVVFLGIVFWAYNPKNKEAFKEHAQIPFQEDEDNDR